VGQVVVLLHVLLHGDLALELGDKLIGDCYILAWPTSRCRLDIPPPSSCLLAETWKEAVSLGTDAVHAGWKAAVLRRTEDCARTALIERRAADRGAARARFRRASILYVWWEVVLDAIRPWRDIMALRLAMLTSALHFSMARACFLRRMEPRHKSLGALHGDRMLIRHRQ
jgi:hypothetical protein